jgi:hypothetical protein
MAKQSKTADLLRVLAGQKPHFPVKPAVLPAAIRTLPSSSAPASRAKPRRNPNPAVQRATTKTRTRGRAIHFWLHEEDEKLIREIAVWLVPHRKRINDSLVIKAVLRAAKTGPDLLAAYDAAIKNDGRLKDHH